MNPTTSTATELRIEAYKWYRLAADQGYGASQNSCDTVTLRMTREEVAEGIHRAKAFAASRLNK
jgi:TPR repeat protein